MKHFATFFHKSIFLYLSLLTVSFFLINPPLSRIRLFYLKNLYLNASGQDDTRNRGQTPISPIIRELTR